MPDLGRMTAIDRLFGIDVVENPYLPPPRKITPGEWATAYVRHQMSDVLVALGEEPCPMPSWDTVFSTVHLVPHMPAVEERETRVVENLGLDAILDLEMDWQYRRYAGLYQIVLNPRDLYKIVSTL